MPLFTSIGLALGASATSAFTAGALAVGVGASALGSGIYSATQSGRRQNPPDLPQTPTVTDSKAKALETSRQKRLAMSRSDSVYTSPLGIGGEADIAKKTLLGN